MKKTLSKIINKIYDGDNDIVDVFEMRYLPRWGVLFIDVCILLFSLFIIEQIGVYFTGTMDFYKKCSLIVGVNVFFMIIFRTYSGIVRHSTFIDLSKIFLSIVYTIFVLVILNVVVYWRMDYKLFKTSLLLVYAGFSFVLLFIYRLFVKEFFNFIREYRKNFQKKRILVLGIDEVSISLAKIIADNSSIPYHLVGFITERTDSKQASLLNRKIYTKHDIEEYQKTLDIDGVLINRNGLTKEAMQEWVNFFLDKGIQMLGRVDTNEPQLPFSLDKKRKYIDADKLIFEIEEQTPKNNATYTQEIYFSGEKFIEKGEYTQYGLNITTFYTKTIEKIKSKK